jgi:arylsulfatase A-like enzyme
VAAAAIMTGALGIAIAGARAPASATTVGLDRSPVVVLGASLLPRISAAASDEDWRRSLDPIRGSDLAHLRGAARDRDVIVVVLESTAAYALPPYGAGEDPMPNLTRIARQALVAENAYAVYPESIRAMLALFAARHPALGTPAEHYGRAPLPSLARSLGARGYRTALFHSGRFDYLGMREVVGALGVDVAEDAGDIGGERQSSFGVEERATVARILRWVAERAPDERLCLAYLPIAGHHPYDSPEPGPFTGDREIDAWRNALHYLDRAIAELVRGLAALGRERALLVFAGDHGEAFGQHPRNVGHSFYLYEENVRVPLIVVAPGLFDRQVRTSTIASHVDVAPTILDLLGVESPAGWEGSSLLDGAPRAALFLTDYAMPWVGLRDGRWKVLLDLDSGRCEVFDLVADPGERRDLSLLLPDRLAEWRQRRERWAASPRP